MTEYYFKAMSQAWAVYYVIKYQKSMSVLQAKQCKAQLDACLDYLAKAKAAVTDADLAEACEEAIADTSKCAEELKALIVSVKCETLKDAASTKFKQKQYISALKFLYWL